MAAPRPPLHVLVALLTCAALGGACRHVPLRALLVRGGAEGLVEPGVYADDARVEGLIATWGARVARAQDRVQLLTGLALEDVEGEAVLAPLGDETRAYELRVVLRQGRRQPQLRVNLERLASGAEDPDVVLARGLTLGVIEVAALRAGGTPPPWALALAGSAAAGDLGPTLERLVKADVLANREVGARVDPGDPALAESTGLAGLLLLLDRGGPELVRAFLQGLADGDPAAAHLQRVVREHGSPWPVARGALEVRLAQVDLAPYRLLVAAERALEETGRAGLLAMLPVELPSETRDELLVLGARAAFAAGDVAAARAALAVLAPDAAARLRDPLAAGTLRLMAEAHPGGDTALATTWAAQLERDHPRSDAVERLRRLARLPEDPERALAALERRAQGAGIEQLDLESLRRLLDLLVRASRFGAAQRLLERADERASAPELAELARLVAREQREPSEATRAAALGPCQAWIARPDDAQRRARVVDHGRAAADTLLAWLAEGRALPPRANVVAVVGACVGAEAVALLAPGWNRGAGEMRADLEALAASTRVIELEVWTRAHAEPALATLDGGALFDALRLDLDEAWVRAEPDVPTALRSEEYAVRREAFERAVRAGEAVRAPRLVARLLADPSPLLRRDAARVAGEAGFEALARAALDDASAPVRRAAALALGRSSEPASLARLLAVLEQDAVPWVRAAAAQAAEAAAPARPQVVAALVQALSDPHPMVESAARQALEEVPPKAVAPAALEALRREVERPEPRGPVLKALFALLEPAADMTLDYYPGMPAAELRRTYVRVRERLGTPPPAPVRR